MYFMSLFTGIDLCSLPCENVLLNKCLCLRQVKWLLQVKHYFPYFSTFSGLRSYGTMRETW